MEETKFYTVNDLMEMGKISKIMDGRKLFPVTDDDKVQLAFAEAISSKMLVNLVEIPKEEPVEENKRIKGQISIFSLGKKRNGKRIS